MFLSFLVSAAECPSQATLLYSIGTKREVERYLSASSHDELAFSLSFLNRAGLYPVVLYGAGPQLKEIIEAKGITMQIHWGSRDWCSWRRI
jgi:hypothetical protein